MGIDVVAPAEIEAIRAFSRAYTRTLGVLAEGLLATPYSLTESRVLFELAQRPSAEVADLRRDLGLDSGYLSRLLTRLERDGLVTRGRSAADARRQTIALTASGAHTAADLDRRSTEQVAGLLAQLPAVDRRELMAGIGTVRALLTDRDAPRRVALREPGPGEYGWVVARHGAVYAAEYGWDDSFEGLVAQIVGTYLTDHDPARERAWIAEVDGRPAGCVFCVADPDHDDVAKLRILLVEPWARGLGLGTRLVDACVAFARDAGYRRIGLWTNDVLVAARRIYRAAGFVLEGEERHHSFGHDLVGEFWSLDLSKQQTTAASS
ncbi:bifunctional helix-turn-helix transcriptional regulator/GNAT family N-acetyltransferase [Pseudonocardia acidicola]|uniref:MarR family transcriptional regulator n=1 Tax=Pseudonocardia acidicola TaxID=2724939 RepID=A0ABX1S8C1_9PSEU|nr:helix-turn-helix domain-containing GNAT family N-acetyltransferase [Pseudonocardia acidicola]NMH97811.1 MarR family transcriptional regulator [Pseudonocardia acidicola]